MTPVQPGGVPRATPARGVVAPSTEPPLKEVLVELWQNLEKLVRQEIALATTEVELKAQRFKAELVGAAVGAALMLAGGLALVAAVILLLALVLPAWAAALITGGVAAAAGFALVKTQRPALADLKPERSMSSLQKDLHTFTEPRQ
jgi:hypothetical protein